MKLSFTKMHGLGNDFMVIDGVTQNVKLTPEKIQQLANRHFGVGFDQLLLVEPPRNKTSDFYYRIFNADGAEVAQCGNGARCLARFVHEKGLTKKTNLVVETAQSRLTLDMQNLDQITIDMGVPMLDPKKIPFLADKIAITYPVEIDNEIFEITTIGFGNPHAVILTDHIAEAPVAKIGKLLNQHELFPEGVNVGFMQIVKPNLILLRVYERGVGETLACGSGAAAAVAAGRLRELLDPIVTVKLPGGALQIEWREHSEPLYLTGPAISVYEGNII